MRASSEDMRRLVLGRPPRDTPPILVGVSLALHALAAPALVKFVLAGSAACALCFFAAGALLAIPTVRRVV